MSKNNYWAEVWSGRELAYMLSWRDVKIRYKQTVVGAFWSVIRPVITTAIVAVVFTKIARLQNQSAAPYLLVVAAGMLPWQFFSAALSDAANSITSNASLITKIYFPRFIIPASTILTSLLDFGISLIIIIVLMIWYRFVPGWQIIFFPVFLFLMLISALGSSLYITALNVKFRDFRHIIPFLIQIGLYITPVAFSSKNVPEKWRLVYSLNPYVGIIDGFRWTLLKDTMYWPGLCMSLLVIVLILAGGIRFFRKMEGSFADYI